MKTALVAVVILVWGTSVVFAGQMSKSDIRALLIGKTVSFISKKGRKGKTHYSKNGQVRLFDSNMKPKKDRGSWRFKGNKLCLNWNKINKGKEYCASYFSYAGTKNISTSTGTLITIR